MVAAENFVQIATDTDHLFADLFICLMYAVVFKTFTPGLNNILGSKK